MSEIVTVFVKAITRDDGEWELEVLGIPFGGPFDGRDADGEYFSPDTDLWLDKIKERPIVYYHGYEEIQPQVIGKELGYEIKNDGVWFRVLLDKASEFAQRVWNDAKQGLARASSGAISHLVRTAPDGHIAIWPLSEISLMETSTGKQPANPYAVAVPVAKAVYQQAGLSLPDIETPPQVDGEGSTEHRSETNNGVNGKTKTQVEDNTMSDDMLTKEEMAEIAAEAAAKAVKEDREAREAERQAEAERQQAIDETVKVKIDEARAEWEKEAAKNNRLPYTGDDAPNISKFGELRKFDHVPVDDMAVAIGVLEAAQGQKRVGPLSEAAYKALAVKLDEAAKASDPVGIMGRRAMVKAGIPYDADGVKANEVNYSTLASFGDEWVGVAYSQALWESIRRDNMVAGMIPSIEVPQGYESITIPLESTDPTFYKVAQVASDAATGGLSRPAPTVTSSRSGTTNQSLTVSKMGARVRWSGELNEDSIVMWANQLRNQLAVVGAETLDHTIIDGDTATTASTNINDIADASAQAGTEVYLLYNGFRKLALVTNTANSRSGGALDEDDFLLTAKLLGAAGKNADQTRCTFILDPATSWKALQNITALKTQDVFSNPTIENGKITNIWGYPVMTSYSFHYAGRSNTGYEYQANTAGKVDQGTAANNTTGSLLLVRWDQWLLGYKRRMTMEVERFPEWDGYQITALARVGLINRDTDAAAITYNLTV